MPTPMPMPFIASPFTSPGISYLAYRILSIEQPIPVGLSVHLAMVAFMIFIEIYSPMFLKKRKQKKEFNIAFYIWGELVW